MLSTHLLDLYGFYGEERGVKVARKHISWYTRGLVGSAAFRQRMNQLLNIDAQRCAVDEFFAEQADIDERLRYDATELLQEAA